MKTTENSYDLKFGEMFCLCCKQKIKKINFNRHHYSTKHLKNILNSNENLKDIYIKKG